MIPLRTSCLTESEVMTEHGISCYVVRTSVCHRFWIDVRSLWDARRIFIDLVWLKHHQLVFCMEILSFNVFCDFPFLYLLNFQGRRVGRSPLKYRRLTWFMSSSVTLVPSRRALRLRGYMRWTAVWTANLPTAGITVETRTTTRTTEAWQSSHECALSYWIWTLSNICSRIVLFTEPRHDYYNYYYRGEIIIIICKLDW